MEVWNNKLLLAEGSWQDVQQAAESVRGELVRSLIRQRAIPCEHGLAYWSSVPRSAGSSALFYLQHAPFWIATGAYNWYYSPQKTAALWSQLRTVVHERWHELKHLGQTRSGVLAFIVGRWRAIKAFWTHWAKTTAKEHRRRLKLERDETAEQIGRLMCAPSNNAAEFVADLSASFDRDQNGVRASVEVRDPKSALAQLQSLLDNRLPPVSSSIPRFAMRWWPAIGMATVLAFGVAQSWRAIVSWFQHSVLDTLRAFVENWVIEPLLRIYMTIRHDPTNEVALVAKESLASDTTSLERMVMDFVKDTNPQLSAAELDALRTRAANGDLTPVMVAYERQLSSPIASIVTGKLVRTLLIQVQKGKVDLEVALSGIDRLLQSQQLVFGLVAAIPALGFLWWVARHTLSVTYRQLYGSESNAQNERQEIVNALSNLDAVAQQAPKEMRDIDVGLVFVHVSIIRRALRSSSLGSRQLQKVLDRMLGHAVERNAPALLADLDRAYMRYQLH